MNPDELLTLDDLAERLRLSPSFVRKLDRTGSLPAPVRIGRTRRWSLREIIDWIEARCPIRNEWESRESTEKGEAE